MELSLQVQRPVWCRNVYRDAPHFKLNPFPGFSRTLTQVMLLLFLSVNCILL